MEKSSKHSKELESCSDNTSCDDHESPITIDIGTGPSNHNRPYYKIHQVNLPPNITSIEKLKHRLHEIFFHDDPFYIMKNKSFFDRIILTLQYFFPVLKWSQNYTFKLFRSDLIAGLTIASLAIPQGISYAKLAYLPPIIGLYSSFVPPLIYAVLGSSKHLAIGPLSISSLVMGSMLNEIVSPIHQKDLYLQLALTTTFFAGLFQACLGLFRLGFMIDFLSKATLTGFMSGAAIVVSLQQLKGLFGISHFTGKMQIIPVMESVIYHEKEWSWKTIVMATCFLLFLLTARQISVRRPKLFWISAAAPLTSVVLCTIILYLCKSKLQDVSIIGDLPKGINPSSIRKLYLRGPHLTLAIKTGIVTGILSLTEGIAIGRTFASSEDYQIDGNKEMMAIRLMNITGCLCSCYVTSGAFSRSAVNYNAGAKTPFSNIVMAMTVLITLLFLMPLFYYTLNLVLAAIIVTAVIGLIDYKSAYRMWKLDKLDFLACSCSFFGVLFLSVQIGLAIAVGVSVFKIILNITRPNTTQMGNIKDTQIYQSLDRYEDASRVPGFLIISIGSPIFFVNSNYIQERILRWVREEEERIQENGDEDLKCVVLDLTVSTLDTSGVDALFQLRKTMDARQIRLALVNPVGAVLEKLNHGQVLELFKSTGLYLTIGEATIDISSSWC